MFKKFIIPIWIILSAGFLFYYLESTPVKAEKKIKSENHITYQEINLYSSNILLNKSFQGKVVEKNINFITEIEGIIYFTKDINLGTTFKKGEVIFNINNDELLRNLNTLQNELKSLNIEKETLVDEIKTKKEELSLSKIKETKYLLKQNDLDNINLSIKNKMIEINNLKDDISKNSFIAPFDLKISSLSVESGEYISSNKSLFSYINLNEYYVELSIPSFIESFNIFDYDILDVYSYLDSGLNKIYLLKNKGFLPVGSFVDVKISLNENLIYIPKKYIYNGFILIKENNNLTKKFVSIIHEDENNIYTNDKILSLFVKEK